MYNEFQTKTPYESDECLSKGICSVNSTLSSIQEVMLLYLKELSFYLLRLKGFGVTNESIKERIIYTLFNIITNAEYNQEQFHDLISRLDEDISQSKILYENFCQKNNAKCDVIKTYFKHSKNFNITEAIKKGEKYFIKKSQTLTPKQKDLFEIMLFLVKSIAIKIVELGRLEKSHEDSYYAVLSMLNSMSLQEFSDEKVEQEIKKFIHIYYEIVVSVFHTQVELYGDITPTEVSFSIVPGKAILVSGSDLRKLERVLKATEGTEINVYTHGVEMLMAHCFPKLHLHPNLKGHYGSGMESSLIDFASFPGAILMSKATLHKIEYLYRGRLFTLDPIAPMGIVKIKGDNYEALIRSALDAKGFSNAEQKPSIRVGFSEDELNKKIDEIVDKITKREIKHLYFIGLANYPASCGKYFEKFFELLPKDCYAISLCCNKNEENIFHLDSFYDSTFLYKIIKRLKEKFSLDQIKTSIFVTKCDKHIIASLIYLKEIGITNVYMCECPPTLVNPVLMKTLQEKFGIKEYSDPQKDIKETLAQQLNNQKG